MKPEPEIDRVTDIMASLEEAFEALLDAFFYRLVPAFAWFLAVVAVTMCLLLLPHLVERVDALEESLRTCECAP